MIKVIHDGKDYYLRIIGISVFDYKMADYLDLSFQEYQNILINNGAYSCNGGECWFTERSDAEAAIKILEPLLVMAKLTK